MIKDAGDSTSLGQEIVRALQADGYLAGRDGNVFSVDARPWINSEGRGVLDLKPVEPAEEGEPGEYEGTAYAPYGHELTIEFKGRHGMAHGELRERFGRALFDRLTSLGRPLAYGEVGGDLFADFLPGRGVRDFPPGTDYEEPGRSRWFEPRLHETSVPAEPTGRPERFQGRGVVFELDGLLQVVPQVPAGDGAGGSSHPLPRFGRTPTGRVIVWALEHPCGDTEVCGDPASWITGVTRRSADAFSRGAVSIDVESDGDVITTVSHLAYKGAPVNAPTQGQESEALAYRGELPGDDAALGKLLLRLTSAVRGDAGEGG